MTRYGSRSPPDLVIAETLGIILERICNINHTILDTRKISVTPVPKWLNADQEYIRIIISKIILELFASRILDYLASFAIIMTQVQTTI